MRTLTPEITNLLNAIGIAPERNRLPPEVLADAVEAVKRAPMELQADFVRARCEARRQQKLCERTTASCTKLEQLLQDMITGNALYCSLEQLVDTPSGPRALCEIGGATHELAIHPEVDQAELASLKPWEYLRVHEKVVVGVARDDGFLHQRAMGEVADFKAYVDAEHHLIRVSRHGQGEEVVTLAEPLHDQELTTHTQLVLMRGNPRWAIATVPSQQSQSRFEVPIEEIQTRLEDLASMESISRRLMMDVVKRILRSEIREQFDLTPLHGVLLTSAKPGMGKTAFMRAFARWLHELGQQHGFDLVLYVVKPNESKSKWHGEDSRIIREELFGAIRARQALPRTRPLFQLLVMDEIDSLGRRVEGGDVVTSAAQADVVTSFLAEMDGMHQQLSTDGPPAHFLVCGMSNRPDLIDAAVKRPGRMGDLVIEMPDIDIDGAEKICAIYARRGTIPWYIEGAPQFDAEEQQITTQFLRPALARVFPMVVLHYSTDTQRKIAVTAGQVMAGVHYEKAVNRAKELASDRLLLKTGIPAITFDDVVDGLLDMACGEAEQMAAATRMLVHQLQIKVPVARVDLVPRDELETHRFLRVHSA